MEYHNGALLIAGEVQLRKFDKMQRGFLYDLGLDDRNAFIDHNFAPPSLRRAIGILGLLHKRVLGVCHPTLASIFPFEEDNEYRYHSKTLRFFWNEVRMKFSISTAMTRIAKPSARFPTSRYGMCARHRDMVPPLSMKRAGA